MFGARQRLNESRELAKGDVNNIVFFNEMASHHVTGAAWVAYLPCSPWEFQCRVILDYIVKFDFSRLCTFLNRLTCVERALFRTYSNPSLRLLWSCLRRVWHMSRPWVLFPRRYKVSFPLNSLNKDFRVFSYFHGLWCGCYQEHDMGLEKNWTPPPLFFIS